MLFAMAMDYLPIQATSVHCERVFSSAKEMDTNKRNRISPVLMEALQLLKFSLKKEHLNFMDGWSTPEAAMLGVLLRSRLRRPFFLSILVTPRLIADYPAYAASPTPSRLLVSL